LADLNEKKEELKSNYKIQQQRFDIVVKNGRESVRSLALLSGTLMEVKMTFLYA
jgi:hypothetical protein